MSNNPIFSFEVAKRESCKASIMIENLTGSGKSGLALILARTLAGDWDSIYAIDTENRSLKLFVGIPSSLGENFGEFHVGNLTKDIGFKPSNYLTFREEAIKAGAKVVIKDSISHAWQYAGGVLEMVGKVTDAMKKPDSYAAWRDTEVAKEKNNLLELLRDDRVHVITTVRVKEKFDYDEIDGKKTLVSLGEQQIQQGDLKYEPDLVLRVTRPGNVEDGHITHPEALVIKSRYAILKKDQSYTFTPELCKQLKEYLEDGVDPEKLLEEQRQDYVEAVKAYLDSHPNAVPIWTELKKQAGFEATKLTDMRLTALKELYIKITMD